VLPVQRVALITAAALVGTAVGLMLMAYALRIYHLVRRPAAHVCVRTWSENTKRCINSDESIPALTRMPPPHPQRRATRIMRERHAARAAARATRAVDSWHVLRATPGRRPRDDNDGPPPTQKHAVEVIEPGGEIQVGIMEEGGGEGSTTGQPVTVPARPEEAAAGSSHHPVQEATAEQASEEQCIRPGTAHVMVTLWRRRDEPPGPGPVAE
jgi:hypothetical protein